jgi:hypothetical protein
MASDGSPLFSNDAIRRFLAVLGTVQVAGLIEDVFRWFLIRMGYGEGMSLILGLMLYFAVYVKLYLRIVQPWD